MGGGGRWGGSGRVLKSRGFTRRLAKTLLAIVAAAIIVLAVVKYLVGPRLVRQQVAAALAESWSGPVRVGTVDFDLGGSAEVYGIDLLDDLDRQWVHVGSARIRTSGWLSRPVGAREIDLGNVQLDLHFDEGRCSVPYRPAPDSGQEPPERIRIGELTVRIVQEGRPAATIAYDGLVLDVLPGREKTPFTLTRQTGEGQTVRIEGAYLSDGRKIDAAGKIAHAFTAGETTAWFGALKWRGLAAASGRAEIEGNVSVGLDDLAAARHNLSVALTDVRIDGGKGMILDKSTVSASLKDGRGRLTALRLAGPIGVLSTDATDFVYDVSAGSFSAESLAGQVELSGAPPINRAWRAALAGVTGQGLIRFAGSAAVNARADPGAPGLTANLRFTPEGLSLKRTGEQELVLGELAWGSVVLTGDRFEVAGLTGACCGGRVNANFVVSNWPNERRALQMGLSATKLNLSELTRSVDEFGDDKVTGLAELNVDVPRSPLRLADLRGGGKLSIARGDFWSVPVLGQVYTDLGLPRNPATISDAHAVFTFTGPVVAIHDAVIANDLAGLECTSGTVNLQTHQVDVVVVGGTFVTMNRLSRLLMGDLKKNLFGRRVHGRWDELTGKDFVVVPPEQIPDQAVQVLTGLAKTGGQLGGEIIKGLDALFRSVIPKPEE